MTLTRTACAPAIALASWSVMSVVSAAAQNVVSVQRDALVARQDTVAAKPDTAAGTKETLARVRDLYTSAAYDEVLDLLDHVDRASTPDETEVDQYRAFCLLALGRSDDARKVIQQIVETNPTFQPSEAQASPRLKDAFRDVRRRVLPTIVRQTYGEAKAAFDRKDLDLAASRFESVVGLLDDADVAGAAELSDLRILSKGFLDLIKTKPQQVAQPAVVPAPVASAAQAPEPPPGRTIYGPNDTDVTPPVAIAQVMPPWHPARRETQTQPYEGAIVVIIDETGAVASINSQGQLPAAYVAILRRAAASWKFQPATRNGAPVKYLKVIGVRLNPNG